MNEGLDRQCLYQIGNDSAILMGSRYTSAGHERVALYNASSGGMSITITPRESLNVEGKSLRISPSEDSLSFSVSRDSLLFNQLKSRFEQLGEAN